jgi:hypothetical protein
MDVPELLTDGPSFRRRQTNERCRFNGVEQVKIDAIVNFPGFEKLLFIHSAASSWVYLL